MVDDTQDELLRTKNQLNAATAELHRFVFLEYCPL